jgi:hypothetical protein
LRAMVLARKRVYALGCSYNTSSVGGRLAAEMPIRGEGAAPTKSPPAAIIV